MGTITIRGVPEDLRVALKARAESEGVSLTELVRRELPDIASQPSSATSSQPSMATWLKTLERRGTITEISAESSPTRMIRAMRDAAD